MILGFAAQSVDPEFAQQNPRIVRIHTLRLTYTFLCCISVHTPLLVSLMSSLVLLSIIYRHAYIYMYVRVHVSLIDGMTELTECARKSCYHGSRYIPIKFLFNYL